MLVKLSQRDVSVCEQAATFRWQLARASGVVNQRRDKGRTDGDLDLLGIKAEMAVARVFDIDHNPFHLGVDTGKDMWLGDISIDVKATFHRTGRLLFKSQDAFKAHCAVLVCRHEEDILDVVGYAPRSTFLREGSKINLGYGEGFCMDQKTLRPIHDLWRVYTEHRLKFN